MALIYSLMIALNQKRQILGFWSLVLRLSMEPSYHIKLIRLIIGLGLGCSVALFCLCLLCVVVLCRLGHGGRKDNWAKIEPICFVSVSYRSPAGLWQGLGGWPHHPQQLQEWLWWWSPGVQAFGADGTQGQAHQLQSGVLRISAHVFSRDWNLLSDLINCRCTPI